MSVKKDLVFVFCKNLKSLAKCWITWFPGFFPWLSSLRVCQSTVFATGMKHSRNKLNLEDSTFWTHWKSWKILLALVPTDKGQMVGVRSLLGKLFPYAAALSMHQLHLFYFAWLDGISIIIVIIAVSGALCSSPCNKWGTMQSITTFPLCQFGHNKIVCEIEYWKNVMLCIDWLVTKTYESKIYAKNPFLYFYLFFPCLTLNGFYKRSKSISNANL